MKRGSREEPESDFFVGRERELSELERLVQSGARLVTVVGPAGAGKTRLATEFARERARRGSKSTACFCDLTEAHTEDEAALAVARALGVQLSLGTTRHRAHEQLARAMAHRKASVLILDNFEQLVAAAAVTVGRWRSVATDVCFLVTSREPLRLTGEVVVAVEPLSEESALALFEVCCRRRLPGFSPTASDRDAMAAIVRRGDRIPLAIELAAACTDVMSIPEIGRRLAKGFDLLASDRRDAPPRHATLESALDWSWNLLEDDERAALAAVSVFRGGFSLDAAERVLGEGAALGLRSLQAKSLLATRRPEGDGGVRFHLLEFVRAYAARRLSERGEGEAVRRAHAHYFASEAERLAAGVYREGGVALLGALAEEHANLIEALRYGLEDGQHEIAGAVATAMLPAFVHRGPMAAYLDLADQAVRCAGEHPDPKLLAARAEARRLAGMPAESLEDCERALEAARVRRDEALEARTLSGRGFTLMALARLEEAAPAFEQARDLASRLNERRAVAAAHIGLGRLAWFAQDSGAARGHLREALTHFRAMGDRFGEGTALRELANASRDRELFAEARSLLTSALEVHRETGDRNGESMALGILGNIALEHAPAEEAIATLEEALALHREMGNLRMEAGELIDVAVGQVLAGNTQGAHTAAEHAVRSLREGGDDRVLGYGLAHLGMTWALRGCFEESRAAFAEAHDLLERVGFVRWSRVADVLECVADAARARAASEAMDTALVCETLAAIRARFVAATGATLEAPSGDTFGKVPEIRIAHRLLRAALGDLVEGGDGDGQRNGGRDVTAPLRLAVDPKARWFEIGTRGVQDLGRRRVLRRLLLLLVKQHGSSTEPLSTEALWQAAWPGDRSSPAAGARRVYVALSTLRKLGLEHHLETTQDGYRLSPALTVETHDARRAIGPRNLNRN